MKHVYKAIILVFVFCISIVFMQRFIQDVTISFDTTVSMERPTFPLLYVQSGGYMTNQMHGYSSTLDAVVVRETMTLVDATKSFELIMDDKGNDIRKISFEIRNIMDNELVEEQTISALDETKTGKAVKIKIKADLEQGREYAAKITAVTKSGRKINYYTRLKYYGDESNYDKKLKFAVDFHNATFQKKKMEEFATYLEPNSQADNKTLAYVDIHSSMDNITWDGLTPTIISKDVPSVREYSLETASIVFNYYVSANSGEEKDGIYRVSEFIRVRYANNRMYLLGYRRTMEQVFDSAFCDVKKSRFKVGITNDTEMELYTSGEERKVSFVKDGTLWYYDVTENTIVRVFSFLENKKTDYERSGYSEHDIQIINMDDDGNIDFMVYGYFNRGDYEGRVGILLYKFHAGDNRIEELVYIPMETTYQVLKEDLNSFGYLSSQGVFYFTMNHTVYAYNTLSRKVSTVAADVADGDMILLKKGHFLAWQKSEENGLAKEINLLNLETEEVRTIKAKGSNYIKLLGSSNDNIIYGFLKKSDVVTSKQGETILPLYQMNICDGEGKVLKTYNKSGVYITGVEVTENIIQIYRAKKEVVNGKLRYSSIKPDSIINNLASTEGSYELSVETQEKGLSELYLNLPEGKVLESKPKRKNTVNTIITDNTTLHLDKNITNKEKYYVYGYGSIIGSFTQIAPAIVMADEAMGLVMDNNNQIVWERGGKYLRNDVSYVNSVQTAYNINTIGACVAMVLQHNGVECSAAELSSSKKSIYELLKTNVDGYAFNLTGCNLDEVLYFVSRGYPVIGMKNESDAVLLVGYDEYYVKYIEPRTGKQQTMLLTNADHMFTSSGNVFLTAYTLS